MFDPLTVAVVALSATLFALIHSRIASKSKLPLPPGPPRNSLLFGNILPSAFAYRKFEEWTQQYGPVFSLRQGFTTVIVIGRVQAAIDIMEKEGAALVDRPLSISAGETLSGGMRVLLTPAGDRFKKMRKALHAHLQPKIVVDATPVLMRSARQHIIDVLDDPTNHQEHAKRYSAAVVMSLAYGKYPQSYSDPDVVAVNRCLTRLGITLRPGVWRVDFWPFLRYIPGYLKELRQGHKEELDLFKTQLEEVRAKLDSPTPPPPSFSTYLLSQQKSLALSDPETAYLAGSMFGAGSDTTASAISIAVLAAALYPDTQARVRAELLANCPTPPRLTDKPSLPQTMAFVLETYRWRPVSAGGFAHRATKDIVWNDTLIPAGATVIGNVWSVGRDPTVFKDPETFNPQRWLDAEGNVREDMRAFTFGFGRRVCPGQHMATASVFLNTALLFWAFDITPDPAGPPIDPYAFTESANTHPLPFKVIFTPREGVREAMEEYE